jgi:hypothetical protein
MKLALIAAVTLLLLLGVLWNAGEAHRKNCVQAKRINCSVLPWQSGEKRPAPTGWGHYTAP